MIDVYQYLYEQGLNGDNIGGNWVQPNPNLRKKEIYWGKDGFPSVYLRSRNNSLDSIKSILKETFKCSDGEANVINESNYRLRNFPTIKSKTLNELVMTEYKDMIDRFNRGETKFPKYTYFRYANISSSNLYSYEARVDLFDFRHNVLCYQIKEDVFSYGIYGQMDHRNGKNPIRKEEINVIKLPDEDYNENGELTVDMREERKFTTGNTRFWLPYFDDIIGYDTNGRSARRLNTNYNHYGIYFDLFEEGTYEFKFNLYITNKNQHEESGTKGPWGARYAFYPTNDNVRGDGDSYCNFNKNRAIPCSIRFRFENGSFTNIEVITEDKSDEVNRFVDEVINGRGFQAIGNSIYIKIFYAIWSYDDAGDWNEWQFAHATAPYVFEYKGE